MTLAGNHDDVSGLRFGERPLDRHVAIRLDDHRGAQRLGHAAQDRFENPRRVLAARIVGGEHDAVGESRRHRSHHRTLGRVAIAARASLAESGQRLLAKQSDCLKQLVDVRHQTVMTYPQEVIDNFKAATITVLNAQAAADSDVAAVLDSMRAFAGKNQAWWNQGAIARAYRFLGWTGWESAIQVN